MRRLDCKRKSTRKIEHQRPHVMLRPCPHPWQDKGLSDLLRPSEVWQR